MNISIRSIEIDSRELDSKQPIGSDVNKIQYDISGDFKSRNRSTSQGRSKSRIKYSQYGIEHVCIRCGKDKHRTKYCRIKSHNLKYDSCMKK